MTGAYVAPGPDSFMDGFGPSLTAQRVAARRLSFERVPASFGDPSADEALARDVARSVVPEDRDDMARYLQARTTFFDRILLNALERGVSQVVVLGAGYDGRALRYAKPGVSWFEVDHPGTQADKRARLDQLGVPTPHIEFVPFDFRLGGLAAGLVRQGYRTNAPAVVLCEGVAVYLERSVLASLLGDLRQVSAPATRLAISISVAGRALGPEGQARRQRFQENVAAIGEPALTVLAFDEASTLFATAGWQVRELSERARMAGFVMAEPAPAAVGAPPLG